MSHQKDSFDDAELTCLALEIMNDISNKATLDPKDSFIYKANLPNNPSIYSTSSHDKTMQYLSYPSTLPYNNSITTTNNDIESTFPSNLPDLSFSYQQKRTVTLKSIYNPPPQHIPPSITIETNENGINDINDMYMDSSLFSTSLSDVSTSISHISRSRTPKSRVNPIPDFTDSIQLQSKPKLKVKRKKKRKKNKNLKDKNKYIENLIWQTPKHYNPFSPRDKCKQSMTPSGKSRRHNRKKQKRKHRKARTQSVATPTTYNNMYNHNDEYLVELNGFDIFDIDT